MCWGCIGFGKIGHLVEVDGNMSQNQYISKLNNHLLPSSRDILRRAPPDYIYQNDNVPPHRGRRLPKWKKTSSSSESTGQLIHWTWTSFRLSATRLWLIWGKTLAIHFLLSGRVSISIGQRPPPKGCIVSSTRSVAACRVCANDHVIRPKN